MRRLLPPSDGPPDEIDPLDAYEADDRPPPADRPWVLVNMIASADGATAVQDRSGPLGGPADKRVFAAVRAVPDVILVGAATVRAEGYGPHRPSDAIRARRVARGQSPTARIAIVTRSLDLDLDSPLFVDAEQRPLLVVPRAAPDLAAVGDRAQVLVSGEDRVDLADALRALRAQGAGIVLVEGGPSLNGTLVAEDLVDELCLSVSPLLVGGPSARIAHGDRAAVARLRLRHVLEEDGLLFLRYTR